MKLKVDREADATQLRQVVMNLITNASESLGGKAGVISISTNASRCSILAFG